MAYQRKIVKKNVISEKSISFVSVVGTIVCNVVLIMICRKVLLPLSLMKRWALTENRWN